MTFVTTALGIIGREAVKILAQRGEPVRALVPNQHGVEELLEWLEEQEVDQPVDVVTELDFSGVDKLILVQAAVHGELRRIPAILEAASDVQKVVFLSMMGASEQSPAKLLRELRRFERLVEATGIPWVHLRQPPFLLMQNVRVHAKRVQETGRLPLPLGDLRVPLIDARDLARAAIRVLEPGHAGRAYELTGPESLSGVEIAERLGAAIGYPVTYLPLSGDQARAGLRALHVPAWLVEDALRVVEDTAGPPTGELERLVDGPRDFDAFARDYAWAFERGEEEGQLMGWIRE